MTDYYYYYYYRGFSHQSGVIHDDCRAMAHSFQSLAARRSLQPPIQ
jgi:hypothetical protein